MGKHKKKLTVQPCRGNSGHHPNPCRSCTQSQDTGIYTQEEDIGLSSAVSKHTNPAARLTQSIKDAKFASNSYKKGDTYQNGAHEDDASTVASGQGPIGKDTNPIDDLSKVRQTENAEKPKYRPIYARTNTSKKFKNECCVDQFRTLGFGCNKKEAKQNAARKMIQKLNDARNSDIETFRDKYIQKGETVTYDGQENQTLEFKQGTSKNYFRNFSEDPRKNESLKFIIAMLNTGSNGKILFGVTDDGRAKGLKCDQSKIQQFIKNTTESIKPTVRSDLVMVDLIKVYENKWGLNVITGSIIQIEVYSEKREVDVYLSKDNEYFVRRGASTCTEKNPAEMRLEIKQQNEQLVNAKTGDALMSTATNRLSQKATPIEINKKLEMGEPENHNAGNTAMSTAIEKSKLVFAVSVKNVCPQHTNVTNSNISQLLAKHNFQNPHTTLHHQQADCTFTKLKKCEIKDLERIEDDLRQKFVNPCSCSCKNLEFEWKHQEFLTPEDGVPFQESDKVKLVPCTSFKNMRQTKKDIKATLRHFQEHGNGTLIIYVGVDHVDLNKPVISGLKLDNKEERQAREFVDEINKELKIPADMSELEVIYIFKENNFQATKDPDGKILALKVVHK